MDKISIETNTEAQACRHEWLADVSSMVAVFLLFGSVFAIMQYHSVTLEWMQGHSLLENVLAYAFVLLDAVLIVSLLCFGPACHANNKACFGTFKGRKRH